MTPSLSFCCLAEPSNLSTRAQGFCMLMVSEGLGNESHWKMSAFGSGFPHENFSQFHPLFPPQKAIFLFCLACLPPPLGGFLLSTLAPEFAASTLNYVLNIVSHSHIYTFHIKIRLQHASVQRRRCRHARRNYLRQDCNCRSQFALVAIFFCSDLGVLTSTSPPVLNSYIA